MIGDPTNHVPLKQVADQGGVPLGRLSKLAIASYFPSTASGRRRRNVDPPVAEALVVLLRAGIVEGPMIQAVLADPAGVAEAASAVASLLGPRSGKSSHGCRTPLGGCGAMTEPRPSRPRSAVRPVLR